MAFRLNGEILQSDTSEAAYRVGSKFRRVLTTLSEDAVPRSLILLGILTEQLDPIEADVDRQIRIAAENVDRAPTANISAETVDGVMWLLHEVKASLDPERKRTIGKLISTTDLDTPTAPDTGADVASGTTSAESDQSETSETPSPDIEAHRDEPETHPKTDTTTAKADGDEFECEFCGAPFASEGGLMSHSIQCEERPSDARFQCEYCENEYVSRKALRTHLDDCRAKERSRRAKRNNADHTCTSCGETFDSPQQLVEHRSENPGDHRQHPRPGVVERGATGAVVHFDTDRGYGFIRSSDYIQLQETEPDRADDLFFHVNEYPGRAATEGEQLRFDIKRADEGFEAVNISRARPKRIERWDDTFASKRPLWGRDS